MQGEVTDVLCASGCRQFGFANRLLRFFLDRWQLGLIRFHQVQLFANLPRLLPLFLTLLALLFLLFRALFILRFRLALGFLLFSFLPLLPLLPLLFLRFLAIFEIRVIGVLSRFRLKSEEPADTTHAGARFPPFVYDACNDQDDDYQTACEDIFRVEASPVRCWIVTVVNPGCYWVITSVGAVDVSRVGIDF